MSSPYASDPFQRPSQPGQPGTVSDPDVPGSFGPDTPNVRDDDPKLGQGDPDAPPSEPLEDDDYAPYEE